MPNSLGTSNGTLIAQRILETLLTEYPVLKLFTVDFSGESALFNQSIKVQMPSALSAANFNPDTGYTASAVSQTEVDLIIDKHVHCTYSFNEWERSSTATNLIERFARNGAHAIGASLVSELCSLVTAENFPNVTTEQAAAWDLSSMLALNKKLNARKLPSIGRCAVFNSDYYAALCADTRLISNPGSPSDTVRSGNLGPVHGIRTIEYAQLADNSEHLGGFAGTPEALILATRVPTIPSNKGEIPGVIEIIVEPNTGLSLQQRTWYDMTLGKENRSYTLMFGVAPGNPACLERIVSQ